jgi:hypothetical protein
MPEFSKGNLVERTDLEGRRRLDGEASGALQQGDGVHLAINIGHPLI